MYNKPMINSYILKSTGNKSGTPINNSFQKEATNKSYGIFMKNTGIPSATSLPSLPSVTQPGKK